ncbi:tetratricopeptide repeat-containing sulfotransferase family protein [Rheinheimera soli]|uniref:tetratricopeptide repeat-containing sulfotransferase family protein n=1 Tax=Rheinheimera soli TaxID=443616 RepID=UPI001E30D26A|nr:sulfotransferase [Rheinheimera soli]
MTLQLAPALRQQHQHAMQLLQQRRFKEAHACLAQLLEHQPDHADSYFLLGVINLEYGQVQKSVRLIEKAVSLHAKDEYLAHLAKGYSLTGALEKAKAIAEALPAEQIQQALTLDTLGVALSRVGLHQLALSYFQHAVRLQQNKASYLYNLGVSLKFVGDFPSAKAAFEQALQLEPTYYQAHYAMSDLAMTSDPEARINELQQVKTRLHSPDALLHIGHALAKEYEAIHNYPAAMAELAQAKHHKSQTLNYQVEEDLALFAAATQHATSPVLCTTGCPSREPIFILGMPRSGTTLVERILSSHSDVLSAGELQDFGLAVKELTATPSDKVVDVETLNAAYALDFNALGERYLERSRVVTGSKPRFIDKLPFNFFYIDLIRRALPNAKIICMMRHPMDTCLGNYRALFSLGSPYYRYAFNLKHTARFYAAFHQLALFWQQQNLPNFRLQSYEDLVQNPEQQIAELLEFCDLDWQQACLHSELNQAPVSTASKVQVREPVNTKSVGRWQKYQPMLEPLLQQLKAAGIDL